MSEKPFNLANPFKNAVSCVNKVKNQSPIVSTHQSNHPYPQKTQKAQATSYDNSKSLKSPSNSSYNQFMILDKLPNNKAKISDELEFSSFAILEKEYSLPNWDYEQTFSKYDGLNFKKKQEEQDIIIFKGSDSIDKYLSAFLQSQGNLQTVMECLNSSSFCNNLPKEQDKIKSQEDLKSQNRAKFSQHLEEEPLDFDALRQQQVFDQNEACAFIPELVIANLNYNDGLSPTPKINTTQPQTSLMLDLKFNVQKQLNKVSYKNVSRVFLTFEETIKTKKYVLKDS